MRISLPVADTHTCAPGVGKSWVWVRVHFSLPAADTRTRALGVGKSRVWVRVRPPIPGGIPMQLPTFTRGDRPLLTCLPVVVFPLYHSSLVPYLITGLSLPLIISLTVVTFPQYSTKFYNLLLR